MSKPRMVGHCYSCKCAVYNEPTARRGLDNTDSPLIAEEYDCKGRMVHLCFFCANDEPSYRYALAHAYLVWTRHDLAREQMKRLHEMLRYSNNIRKETNG